MKYGLFGNDWSDKLTKNANDEEVIQLKFAGFVTVVDNLFTGSTFLLIHK